jgi:hypothetical protein
VKVALAAIALVATLAGCSSSTTIAARQPAAAAGTSPLATSAGDWAIVPMGGAGSFWEVLHRGATGWRLVTPPAVASTGGLVAATSGTQLTVGFLPSVSLTFSPLAATDTQGQTWSTGLVDAALAAEPDALAAGPGGRMLALLRNGNVLEGTASGGWRQLTSARTIAASAAGRRCGLTALTAVSFGLAGQPLVAGDCANRGVAGVFGTRATPAGPVVPAGLAGKPARVLRMAGSATLLQAGGELAIVWPGYPAAVTRGNPLATGFGANGATWILLPGRRAEVVAAPGGSWQATPRVPAGTVALAAGPSGSWQAIAAAGRLVNIWQAGPVWRLIQRVPVPIP